MTETPRTEAVALRLVGVEGLFCDDKSMSQYNDLVDVSRTLEADLIATQKERDAWKARAIGIDITLEGSNERLRKAEQALALRGEPVAWRWKHPKDSKWSWHLNSDKPVPPWPEAVIEPLVSGAAPISGERMVNKLAELAEQVLEVADYLNDACNNAGEIAGSECVDPLMSIHGDLLELLAGSAAVSGERVREATIKECAEMLEGYAYASGSEDLFVAVEYVKALSALPLAAQPEGDGLVCIGELIEIDDDIGTTFVEWNDDRYELATGAKIYAALPERKKP